MYLLLKGCKYLDGGGTVADGDILIHDDRIEAIGDEVRVRKLMPQDETVSVKDMRGTLLIPGFVNAHGHTAMTLVRGIGSGLPLKRWLEEAVFPVEAKMTPSDISAGVTWGVMEMISGGTTCVADMYDFPEVGGEIFQAAGMKANICRVGLNFVPGRLDDCVKFTREWNSSHDGRVIADICIHSEYLTDGGFCRELAAATKEFKRPLHVHVSETGREHEECVQRNGKTPIGFLADTGLLDCGAYAAHCVHCTDDDFEIMRERGVTLVHNPSSNMKLGSGFARIPAAEKSGINIALGTDGCASNDNLDMFEEIHLAALIHKGITCDPTATPARSVLAMASKNGAAALEREDTGVIGEGMKADLCALDLSAPRLSPALDYPNLLAYSAHSCDVVMTMVDGRILYDHGEFTTIDAEKARFDFTEAIRRLGLI